MLIKQFNLIEPIFSLHFNNLKYFSSYILLNTEKNIVYIMKLPTYGLIHKYTQFWGRAIKSGFYGNW